MKVVVIGGGPGGLYFAILLKQARPDDHIVVYERNRADDSFGFGVVFSDETLGQFLSRDPQSYKQICNSFAYWDDIDISYKGNIIACSGNGFCGCSRITLLTILQRRCIDLGVTLHFEHEIADVTQFADADIIVAADGINSPIRTKYIDGFQTQFDWRKNKFAWLGSTRPLDAFTYFFREVEGGAILAHSYQYSADMSTWVFETTPLVWERLGFADKTEEQTARTLEQIFAEELQGHPLLINRSMWRNFPTITNANWHYKNIVLLGDAKSTAHYSIGAGTKLAMEDAIALVDAIVQHGNDVPAAFTAYRKKREDEVSRLQHAANVSLRWFEYMDHYMTMPPMQFAFSVMSRSKQLTYDNLRLRDHKFIEAVDKEFADQLYATHGYDYRNTPTIPMLTRFRLREMVLKNRIVVSPMCQYMAVDGELTDWHFSHYTTRALGGAGLLYTEMVVPSLSARISPGCAGIFTDSQEAAWRRINEFTHTYSDTKTCLQLGHAGRKGATKLMWEGMDKPLSPDLAWPLVSASPLPYDTGAQTPDALDEQSMQSIIDEFVAAAKRGIRAGFDMLELHCAHGYLLASFISPLTNCRHDAYGGTLQNRMRFPLQLFDALRAVWPSEKPMSVRISATDWKEGGLTEEDAVAVAELFSQHGADLIDVSTGQTVPDQQPLFGRMWQTPFADLIRNSTGVATMAVGNISSGDQVNTILAAGRADLVAIGRPHLINPNFTILEAAKYGMRVDDVRPNYTLGRSMIIRLAEQQQAEWRDMKLATKPHSHGMVIPRQVPTLRKISK